MEEKNEVDAKWLIRFSEDSEGNQNVEMTFKSDIEQKDRLLVAFKVFNYILEKKSNDKQN